MSATLGVIVVAAGRGERLGAIDGPPKALVEVSGTTLLALALERVTACQLASVVVVHTPDEHAAFAAAIAAFPQVVLIPGGVTRADSVRAGLTAVGDVARIAVHDAARALVPSTVIAATVAAVTGAVVAAAPAVPIADTLKRVEGGEVVATVDRDRLYAVHTPQVFAADVLRAVHEWAADRVATDDLALVELARDAGVVTGGIRLVPGDPRGLKVTYPGDLAVLAALLAAERADAAAAIARVTATAPSRGGRR